MEKYFAKVNENDYKFELTDHADNLEIKDQKQKITIANIKRIDQYRFSILLNNQSYIVNVSKRNDELDIIIRGKKFSVEIDSEKSKQWKQILAASNTRQSSGEIKSPMPGMVIKILVKEGQQVNKGDSILILSAMKMENELKSETSGIVNKIYVKNGVAVEKNQPLLIIN